ncbi:cell division protein [Neisseria chenwenguii]|uniref:cell division protein n=1 Tax=Neisseria chenwenguii TaxID=1853278 RepID=UPI000F50B0BB|nr:cell division protein [Neisseria chenwenguii]ROV56743.1 cell division protein [Neisseria chenwenguii]
MKWLFAVLVALNIIVFGGMVAHRMTDKHQTAAVSPSDGGKQELARPQSLGASSANNSPATPDWIAASETAAASEPAPEAVLTAPAASAANTEQVQKAQLQKEQEAKLAQEKEKREREEKARREKEAREKALAKNNMPSEKTPAGNCASAAHISMDEDDYHRIKGLLTRWPHAASRSVEKRGAQTAAKTAKTFRVMLPSDDDAIAKLASLNDKGFSASIYEGGISVGVVRSRSFAQVLISRLSGAGFGGARIVEQEEKGASDSGQSVSRMNVTFMAVDAKTLQDIRDVVGRYGNLSVKGCK